MSSVLLIFGWTGLGERWLRQLLDSQSAHTADGHISAAARIPPAVKGTPSYDVRMAVLRSQANEAFLTDFYKWNIQNQQSYLDRHFGAVEALSASAYDDKTIYFHAPRAKRKAVEQSDDRPQENRLPVGSSEKADVVPRDPDPYTGFSAGNKRGSPRTVLHDPIAPQPAQTQSARYQQDLLESSKALPSIPGAHDSTSSTYNTAPLNLRGTYSSFPFSNLLLEALDRITRPDALDRHFARVQEVHDMLEARASKPSTYANERITVTGTTHINTAASKLTPDTDERLTRTGTTHINTAASKPSPDTNELLTRTGTTHINTAASKFSPNVDG